MKTRLRILSAALALVSGLAFAAQSKPANEPLEFPLLLQTERTALRAKIRGARKSPNFFNELFLYHIAAHRWYYPVGKANGSQSEPFGLHVDSNPFNGPEPLRAVVELPEEFKVDATKAHTAPVCHAAFFLAAVSRKHVLLSARIEPLAIRYPGTPKRTWTVDDFIHTVLEPNQVTAVPLGEDTYVMLELSSERCPFPHGLGRAIRYEKEREAWLRAHPYYSPQGLIYQPTGEPLPDVTETSDLEIKVRHAAAFLAKLADKEVFVNAGVEKRDFRFPYRDADTSPETIQDDITRQLDRASVLLLELDANSLALLPK